jgi:hypothetical protein
MRRCRPLRAIELSYFYLSDPSLLVKQVTPVIVLTTSTYIELRPEFADVGGGVLTLKPTALQALLLCLVVPSMAHGQRQERAFKTSVRFLATSTSFRTDLGESQDVYLVSVGLEPRAGEWTLARLVDEFPPYRTSLPSRDLQSGSPMTLRIRRDASCDFVYAEMRLRTRPGDPMAILPEPLGYSPDLSRSIPTTEILPCYRTVRPAK